MQMGKCEVFNDFHAKLRSLCVLRGRIVLMRCEICVKNYPIKNYVCDKTEKIIAIPENFTSLNFVSPGLNTENLGPFLSSNRIECDIIE